MSRSCTGLPQISLRYATWTPSTFQARYSDEPLGFEALIRASCTRIPYRAAPTQELFAFRALTKATCGFITLYHPCSQCSNVRGTNATDYVAAEKISSHLNLLYGLFRRTLSNKSAEGFRRVSMPEWLICARKEHTIEVEYGSDDEDRLTQS